MRPTSRPASLPALVYDVKDVDTSADGKRVVFAMRGPLSMKQKSEERAVLAHLRVRHRHRHLHAVINPATDPDPVTVNDVSPHYLPDGRIVFSSTRQTQSQGILLDEGKPQFAAQNEARQEPAFVLDVDERRRHRASPDLLQPEPRPRRDGARQRPRAVDALGQRARQGRHAPVLGESGRHRPASSTTAPTATTPAPTTPSWNSCSRSEMQDGRILTLDAPVHRRRFRRRAGHHRRHALRREHPGAARATPDCAGPAQTRATHERRHHDSRALAGRPLQLGLPAAGTAPGASWSAGRSAGCSTPRRRPPPIVPCSSTTPERRTPPSAPPLYSVWMFDPTQNTLLPVMPPVEGVMVTDVAAAQPRTLPNIILDKVPGVDLDQNLVDARRRRHRHQERLRLRRRGHRQAEHRHARRPGQDAGRAAPGALPPPARRRSRFPTRPSSTSPAPPSAPPTTCARSSATPRSSPTARCASRCPPMSPSAWSVLDANGRRISPMQGAWLQVRPGEIVTCNGCHTPASAQHPVSHGRQGLFALGLAGAATTGVAVPAHHLLRHRPPSSRPGRDHGAGAHARQLHQRHAAVQADVPSVNVLYTDVWTDPAQATPGAPINLRYDDATQFMTAFPTSATCVTAWAATCRIIINYPAAHPAAVGSARARSQIP